MKKIILLLAISLGTYASVFAQTINPGIIAGNQTISSGATPSRLTSEVRAVGATSYRWERSTNGSSWSTALMTAGEMPSESYQPPALTVSTYFRRAAVNGSRVAYSNSVLVTVRSGGGDDGGGGTFPILFSPGSITGDQTIASGETPATITGGPAKGGSVLYQWQKSVDNSTWTNISRATSTSYSPGPLTVTTYFRRRASRGLETGYSNTVKITVTPNLSWVVPVANVVETADVSDKIRGLKTYEKVAVLDGPEVSGTPTYVERRFAYDYQGRLIQTVETNHLGGKSVYSTKYDFVGNVLASHESHKPSSTAAADTKLTTFAYDYRGRLLSETTTVNGGTPAIVTYAYDDLGKLTGKTYGTPGTSTSVTETHSYNIQGWLTGQSSSLFDMKLRYHDPQKGTAPSYTGNITEWEWTHRGTGGDNIPHIYTYTYDKLSRLTDSRRYQNGGLTHTQTEQGITYDRNGNFLTLKRFGASADNPVDDINSAVYNGNQIASIKNKGTTYTYTYDANGNNKKDGLNALNLEYNFLNLTAVVRNNSNVVQAQYRWLADGTKAGVRNSATGTSGLEYLGSLVYKRDNAGLKLESAGFGGGRIEVSHSSGGSVYTPNYYIVDHLGSTRAIWNGSSTVPRSNYTPFGFRWTNGAAAASRYQFAGYEDQPLLADKIRRCRSAVQRADFADLEQDRRQVGRLLPVESV